MISKLPESIEERMELHLADTSILYPIIFRGERKKKIVKKLRERSNFYYQQKIIEAIESCLCKSIAVTPTVMEELLKSEEANLWFTHIGEDPNTLLYLTGNPPREDHFLLKQFKALGSKKRQKFDELRKFRAIQPNRGDYSVALASIEYGIPSIVTDDDDFFASQIRSYLEKQWMGKWGKPGRYFEILTSKDFCQMYLCNRK